ncbi:hypothetical protein CXT84_11045 [Akkermansia muciniphila]|nr:hypothetical protein CXT84_11045 [Akkermansia muciniphila]
MHSSIKKNAQTSSHTDSGTTGSLLEKSRPISVFQPPFFTAVLKIKSRSAVNGTALKEFRHQSR